MMKACMAVAAGAALLAARFPGALDDAAARSGPRTSSAYSVEIFTTGPFSTFPDPGCSSGIDQLVGRLVGDDGVYDERVVYTGVLQRTTRVNYCYTRHLANGEDAMCNISIAGGGSFDVELTVYPEDRRGGFLKITGAKVDSSRVSGTCDPSEMTLLQHDYGTGDTAGNPNGQPIEDEFSSDPPFYANGVIRLPVGVYPAGPNSAGWTLKVIARLCCSPQPD